MSILRLRLYPGLAYMERVAMKDDVIPLREPIKLRNGQTTSSLPIARGQVCFQSRFFRVIALLTRHD
jgi:hypothetical protein